MAEAYSWSLKAAQAGLPEAQFNVSVMYKQGDGVEENIDQAVEWAVAAAEQGHLGAQRNLGAWYGRGEGVERNEEEAFKWYLMAAKQGYESARIIVGGRYAFGGGGVPKDVVRGYGWLATSDAEMAVGYVDKLKEDMPEADIEKGEAYAATCIESNYQDCE